MSQEPIRITIPPDDTNLVEYFQGELKSDFTEALDFDIVAQSDRATLDDVEVIGVTVTGDQIEVEYSFDYSAYLGCRDANWADTETSSVCGSRRGNEWWFDRHVPWVPRSTADEF